MRAGDIAGGPLGPPKVLGRGHSSDQKWGNKTAVDKIGQSGILDRVQNQGWRGSKSRGGFPRQVKEADRRKKFGMEAVLL